MLTDKHKNLPIVTDLTFLSLISQTCNFIPTPPARQFISNVNRSLHVLCCRIHSALSQKVHFQLIQSNKTASAAFGLPDWRPKVFQFTNARLQENSRVFVFTFRMTITCGAKFDGYIQNSLWLLTLFAQRLSAKPRPSATL